MTPDATNERRNLNTILLWVTLAVLGFVGWTSYGNSLALAKLEGSLVTRNEVDAKIAEVKALVADANGRNLATDKDLTALKMALAERGLSIPKQAK